MPQDLPAAGNWVQGEIARLEDQRHALIVQREQEYAAITQTDDDIDAVDQLLTELGTLRGRC
jgi:hypothetical protein